VRGHHIIVLLFLCAVTYIGGCRPQQPQTPNVDGTPQTKWIDPNSIAPSPIRHERLTAEQVTRVKRLQETFKDVDPSPLEKWVEDFKRDEDPDREIRVFEGMAEAYRAFCKGKRLTPQAKKDAFQVVLLRSGAPDSEVIPQLKLKVLTVKDAREILKHYKMAPAPVQVYSDSAG
jgi:hypothetical protein